jgi:hypothetical protein
MTRLPKSVEGSKTGASPSVLRVNSSGDTYEREADRVADQVVSGHGHKASWSLSKISMNASLQRECACGGQCDDCKKKKEQTLQRKAQTGVSPTTAPVAVHNVLRGSGRPLDQNTRGFMESRFGHDFGRVRIFNDEAAATSARAVAANAYTVGDKIVFNSGRYAPESQSGRRLLAHELAHVVQQEGGDAASQTSHLSHDSHGTLQRQAKPGEPTDVELWPVGPEEDTHGINLPKVSEQTWKQLTYKPGQSLQPEERSTIQAHLQKAGIAVGAVGATINGAKFLLHDTSSSIGAASIRNEASLGRGPLGKGVSAYAPKADAPTIARPAFYESRRPSTTEHEKDLEAFSKPGDSKLSMGKKVSAQKQRRDDAFRTVWNDTRATEQAAALDRALAGQSLTPTEIQEQKTGNKKKRSDAKFNPGAENVLKAGSTEKMTTSASWAVEEICSQLTPQNVQSKAVAGKAQELTDTCATLTPFFTERKNRIESTASVEIVQPGVKSSKGNQNTCDPTNSNNAPLDNPPYTNLQYQSVVSLYLRAALIAGVFPEITTHFAVDANVQGHCDPRCFDLTRLYKMIATAMGHSTACVYGVSPSYGLKWGANNIWWDNGICHGNHP